MRKQVFTLALLAAMLPISVTAADLDGIGAGARHPSYKPDTFGKTSSGAGRNDALGKTREEIRRGPPLERREPGSPGVPKAWDTNGDGELSAEEYRDGFYGRYKGDDPTLLDKSGLDAAKPKSEAERQLER
jgi:hypothetical protein